MLIRLDIMKLTQAAAYLLKRHNGFITRMRLLKLLYMVDRELLTETRRPLTGDRPVAMDFGPVLTHTYDLLKGEATGADVWNRFIQQVAPYTHKLAADPGVGKLSKRELAKLDEVVQRYWWIDDEELSDITHEFPEWKRNKPPKKSRQLIPLEHVLEALGLGNDIERLKKEAQAEIELDALLAGAAE
ncbi:MAG: putative phage-associated protein [Phycisphaerales bacterium]|nr:putative phage-associated protein [Phycisphaerales bacterium]